MDPRTLLIRKTTWEADGVLSLSLEDPGGGELPSWDPGSHIDLQISPTFIRQYSLCGDPHDLSSWRIAILREPHGRGGSELGHQILRAGSLVEVLGLRSNFPLVDATEYFFIAGGIGITPILPMVACVHERGATWHLLYGGRHRDSMAFLGELGRFGGHVTVSPEDENGLLDLRGAIDGLPASAAVYCCGPEPLIDALEALCRTLERPAPHVERFRPTPARIAETAATSSGDVAFDVVLRQSDLVVHVPIGMTVLDAIEAAGVRPLYSCREGYCGTCEVSVLAGEIDHRDTYLPEEVKAAGNAMMICVSRARTGDLTIDL